MRSQPRRRFTALKPRAGTLITPGHPRWSEFLERLAGPRGLDVRGGGWHCAGGEDKSHSRRILLAMGLTPPAVAANLAFFERHGGYCDCEVWMNVGAGVVRGDDSSDAAEEESADTPIDGGLPCGDGW